MARVLIAVGSNLEDRLGNINRAQGLLAAVPGIKIIRTSKIYETLPVGGPPQGKYLNAAWEIETTQNPRELLELLLDIERQMGRRRRELHEPRTIDLDILFYDQRIVDEPGLVIPHPRLQDRAFVLEPLADIAPDWEHPQLRGSVRSLWESLRGKNA